MSAPGPEALTIELRMLVERELERCGKAGVLRLEGSELVFNGDSGEMRAALAGTLEQWESLPDDLRARRVQQIAELLTPAAEAPRREARRRVTKRRDPASSWTSIFPPLAVIVLTAGAIAVAYHFLAPAAGLATISSGQPSESARVVAPPSSTADQERTLIASSACEQARGRVGRGANVGPLDDEGWVVELILLREGVGVELGAEPQLARFISRKPASTRGTVIWPGAKRLLELQRFDAQVSLNTLPPLGRTKASGLDLVFSGPYVVPYFREDQREEYLRLADALAEALHATAGGLFARCAHTQAHQIGSWFLGRNPGSALGSLLYFMATYSDTPLLLPTVFSVPAGPAERSHAFDAINQAAAGLDRDATATLIGGELGMLSGSRGQPTRLTFPFRDANRATRASLLAARALRLAAFD